jgi:hypothetical protein
MKRLLLLTLLGLVSACGDTIYNLPSTPAPSTSVVQNDRIEFRVTGNANSARIRYSTPTDGLVQTISSLPFFTSFFTNQPSIFLSLDVTPISYPFVLTFPFMSAQILVDGDLFREATSNDTSLGTLSVTGTFRFNSTH